MTSIEGDVRRALRAPDRAGRPLARRRRVDLRDAGRWAAALVGTALAVWAWRRGTVRGLPAGAVAGALFYRAATHGLGLSRALRLQRRASTATVVPRARGIKIEQAITVERARPELFRAWRRVERLPTWMTHLAVVEPLSRKRSHWVARGPAGTTVEWDAEIFEERDDELIAWRSLEGSDVENVGSVRFQDAPGGHGTEVTVSLAYEPPGGRLGRAIAALLGEDPEQQIREDLRRFKLLMEAGEGPTTAGQPTGGPGHGPTRE